MLYFYCEAIFSHTSDDCVCIYVHNLHSLEKMEPPPADHDTY